jgi:hypothetical protein
VAIQQVSRITVRKGLAEDLPQPLAGAELGWATDQRRLYIGNGALADGAPVVGNTEILTEFSDLFEYSSAYTYQGDAAGYVVQTGETSGTPISQSLQSRLDSYAIVTDFGARGDGVTDDTSAINRALFQLYCVQNNAQVRRSLFFPAGEYIVTDTILIPPYARLYGEGRDSSIIKFSVLPWAANTAYNQAGILVEDSGNYYRSRIPVPATGIPISNTTYWDPTTLPAYVARTADSQQQTGANIGVGGATPPQKISVSNLAFRTEEAVTGGHDVFLFESVSEISVQECSFQGPLTTANLDAATNDLAGARFVSTASLPCESITLDRCSFTGLTYGVNTQYLTKGVTVRDGDFRTLYQGVILGGTVVLGGPQGFRIVGNTFDEIYAEGVVINTCSLNGTAYNTFLDVGNKFAGSTPFDPAQASPVLSINADNNVSVGDVFARTDAQAAGSQPRVYLFDESTTPRTVPASIAFTNGRTMQLGAYTRQSGLQQEIADGTTVALFTIDTSAGPQGLPFGNPESFAVDYTMIRDTATSRAVRTGRLTVVSSDTSDSSIPNPLTWQDEFTENSQVDMTLVVAEVSGDVTVSVSSSATGEDGRIYYSLNYLA